MSISHADAKSASHVRGTDPAAVQSAAPRGFAYNSQQYRVVFGAGTAARLNEEVERLGIRRVLVLTTSEQRDQGTRLGAQLGSRLAGVFSDARMHTPVEITEAAMAVVQAQDIDGFVAIGGGSTVGLGKALSSRTGLPHIAMPTTYAGSEMTPILGETQHGIKTTRRSQDLIPDTVIYDVDLTLGLPSRISAASGMNAIAHAVEALYAEDANPLTSLMAEEGIAALGRALPRIVVAPSDGAARHDALYGAWLCGTCLGAVGMSLHHKLCHVLGGSFDLPHAETHAIMLPHTIAYVCEAARDRLAPAVGIFGDPLGGALYDFAASVGAPLRLADLGAKETELDRVTDLALASPYWSPRELQRDGIRDLLQRAWTGQPPTSRGGAR